MSADSSFRLLNIATASSNEMTMTLRNQKSWPQSLFGATLSNTNSYLPQLVDCKYLIGWKEQEEAR